MLYYLYTVPFFELCKIPLKYLLYYYINTWENLKSIDDTAKTKHFYSYGWTLFKEKKKKELFLRLTHNFTVSYLNLPTIFGLEPFFFVPFVQEVPRLYKWQMILIKVS